MKAGYAFMNDLTVIQASQGLLRYLVATLTTESVSAAGVVVGHDHRHNSDSFARLTAAVFLSQGVKVYYYPDLVHTPLVPFAVKTLGAVAGIMITASHNPKNDNGYKVYWGNGCQIIPPHDKGIASKIIENLVPWTWDYQLVETSSLCVRLGESIVKEYFDKIEKLCQHKEDNIASQVRICYTAMHGVGFEFAKRAFERFGLPTLIPTEAQVLPDPDFPTVEFPNPEEGKGSLALAFKTAEAHGAKVVFANDPDADRFALAEQLPSGEWHVFSGNEIGTLFGCHLSQNLPHGKYAMLASTVSSKMLEYVGKARGFRFEETLTGFKWLGNRAIDLESSEDYQVLFAYEEAIGFMIGDIVRDKDGISALAVCGELVVQLQKKEMTLFGYLDSLRREFGYFVSNNSYFVCHDPLTIKRIFERIRFGETPQSPFKYELQYPRVIGGSKVTAIRDLTIGYDSMQADNKPVLPVSASSEMITFRFENGGVLTLRTSGTEPKIKYYSELGGKTSEAAKAALDRIVEGFVNELMQPERNHLGYRKE
ncbi:uncharacterized protein BJ171DRAFT_422329 [Polychytrium aggregatum]|uniref:uncharacterized protein n=1 Tax=Polychytrium aggregatum TaxID=110093 RepID=UPI0022FDF0C8|nr:uncharacterized protein BJ171DRAFT_422329 [Polychytrium aggregatum]KAI9206097.1 hypothetical protein BJ171DRAFT_422329 [Polychytrium aggregatum]